MEIFALREQAIPIDVATFKFEACCLSSMFCAKKESAQISSIRRFIARNGYVYCFDTHTSQQDPKETCAEAEDFIKIHCTLLDEPVRDKRYMTVIKLCNDYFSNY